MKGWWKVGEFGRGVVGGKLVVGRRSQSSNFAEGFNPTKLSH